jgi:ATP-dependent DNA ligase
MFVEWTPDGPLRRSQFIALREDKRAREVRRDTYSGFPAS